MIETRGRVLGLTRFGVWVLLVLAAANGLFLYLVPARAEFDYAWSIKPPVNAAFIGAGFVAGAGAPRLVLFTPPPRRAPPPPPPPPWGLGAAPLAAAPIHPHPLKFAHAPTWGWGVV